MAQPGDLIEIKTILETLQGTLIPSADEKILILKLDNGYNMGVERKDVLSMKVLKEHTPVKEKTASHHQNQNLKTITILHTGGTIASKVDYRTGGVVARFSPTDLLEMFPELGDIANFDSKLISNMWSDDLRFCHFWNIAKAVEEEAKKGVKGIIIGMGTDNLAVASAALAFVFEEINIPILLVGAQRSSDRGSSDAAMNLICAAEFITKTDFTGVAICMHSGSSDSQCNILPPCKTRKLHSSRRDAFKPVNDGPIATVDYKSKEIKVLKNIIKSESLKLKPKFEEKVGLLKIHINMHPEEFEAFSGFKGLIIEGTGLGHTPLDVLDECTEVHDKIKETIKKLNEKGVVMVMTTQCLFGRVNMNVYSKGRTLQQLGIIPGEDMLPETAFIKLAWLLGNYSPEEAKKMMVQNLRGEITNRTEYEEDFLK